ncbi:MAG: GSCFA domain-containing protein [Pseudomonadota bacterium]|nr:GSCFA domain-containing protein [Pseudomonadota bacterium]
MELRKLEHLYAALKSCEFLIVTCGNVLDYFMPQLSAEYEVGPAVAPKFLAISSNEDIILRSHLTGKLKEAGAVFRVGRYVEVGQAVDSLYAAIRAINPSAVLLLTLSPVPIDSAIGLRQKLSAVEIDCISKSMLRVALQELMEKHASDAKLFYFPSFEIVRWVGACMNGAIFGGEDAASRHVSQTILNGVYDYFIHKFVKTMPEKKG